MNDQNSNSPRPLGPTLITPKARCALHPQEVLAALYRHACGLSKVSTLPSASGVELRIVTEDQSTTIASILGETDFSNAGAVDAWVCGYGCRTCGYPNHCQAH